MYYNLEIKDVELKQKYEYIIKKNEFCNYIFILLKIKDIQETHLERLHSHLTGTRHKGTVDKAQGSCYC